MRLSLLRSRLVLFALACPFLSGCHYRSPKDTFYLVATNLKVPYWQTVQEGFNSAAHQYGVTARVVGPESYDPNAEVNALRDAIDAHPAGILVSASSADMLGAPIAEAIAAGVPVITVDSDAPNSQRLFFLGTNNLAAGFTGGQYLVNRLHGKGNVVFFSLPGQPNAEDRLKGYMQTFADHPGIHVVDVVGTSGKATDAFDRAAQYATQTGPNKIDAFVCLEAEAGKAVAEVLRRNHLTDRTLIAMDIDPDTLKLIQDGTIAATVSQRPYTMGLLGLKLLDEAHRSHKGPFRSDYSVDFRSPFPTFVDTGSALITQDNASLYEHPADQPSE